MCLYAARRIFVPLRMICTTSCDVKPTGLSTTNTPEMRYLLEGFLIHVIWFPACFQFPPWYSYNFIMLFFDIMIVR